MKAIVCEEFGPIDDLQYTDVETPEPGKGEVRVNVKATGVNFPDGLWSKGYIKLNQSAHLFPGWNSVVR